MDDFVTVAMVTSNAGARLAGAQNQCPDTHVGQIHIGTSVVSVVQVRRSCQGSPAIPVVVPVVARVVVIVVVVVVVVVAVVAVVLFCHMCAMLSERRFGGARHFPQGHESRDVP